MTYKEVADMIYAIGLPCAYRMFPEGAAPPPPFICFYFDGADDFIADNSNYQRIRPLTIELYTDNKDYTVEETVEAALSGLVYSRSETYIDTEKLYLVIYETEIIITEKNNG